MQTSIAFGLLIGTIICYSIFRAKGIQLQDFLYNAKQTKASSTFPSVVAGNIGAGTIYGLYTFAGDRPLLALSIALSYAIGLALAGFLAPRIRVATMHVAEASLVGFIAERHGVSRRHFWIVWSAIASVFVTQLAVELMAVGDVINHVFAVTRSNGLLLAALIVGSYLIVGGYRSATVSAHIQAPLVVGMTFLIGAAIFGDPSNLPVIERKLSASLDYVEPIGAFVLIAPAVFLSIDNWHRIVAAESTSAAKNGFLTGSVVCGVSYVFVISAGILKGASLPPTEGLMFFLSPVLNWIVPVIIAVAIFSVMDTAIPPLVAGMPGSGRGLAIARLYTFVLIVVIICIAMLFGSIVQGIIAAFSSLAVFLPATLSAILWKRSAPIAILIGIPTSVGAAIVLTILLKEYAVLASVIFSFLLYIGLSAVDRAVRERYSVPG